MQLADVVAAMVGTTVRDVVRGSLCRAEHPDTGERCVLKSGNPHRRHKTADCRRWESTGDVVRPG